MADRLAPTSKPFNWAVLVLLIITAILFLAYMLTAFLIPHPSASQATASDNLFKSFSGVLGLLVGTVAGKMVP
jgi:hypothetical protein